MRILVTATVDDHLGADARGRARAGDRRRSTDRFEDAGFKSDAVPTIHTIAYTNRGLLESPFELDDDRLVAATRHGTDARPDRQAEDPLAGEYDAVRRPDDHRRHVGVARRTLRRLEPPERTLEERRGVATRDALAPSTTRRTTTGPCGVGGGSLARRSPATAGERAVEGVDVR